MATIPCEGGSVLSKLRESFPWVEGMVDITDAMTTQEFLNGISAKLSEALLTSKAMIAVGVASQSRQSMGVDEFRKDITDALQRLIDQCSGIFGGDMSGNFSAERTELLEFVSESHTALCKELTMRRDKEAKQSDDRKAKEEKALEDVTKLDFKDVLNQAIDHRTVQTLKKLGIQTNSKKTAHIIDQHVKDPVQLLNQLTHSNPIEEMDAGALKHFAKVRQSGTDKGTKPNTRGNPAQPKAKAKPKANTKTNHHKPQGPDNRRQAQRGAGKGGGKGGGMGGGKGNKGAQGGKGGGKGGAQGGGKGTKGGKGGKGNTHNRSNHPNGQRPGRNA